LDTPHTPEHGPDLTVAEEAATLRDWLKRNAVSLAITLVAVVLICVYWNPVTVAKVVVGLGLVIFIHELGHFLAAKWCDVHVETFSIGFGPAIPGCRFRYGETTYMIGLLPLGGYVKMVGEGDGDEGDDDPRSFKNKSVLQRMLIISAGVTMNILLACVCFVFVYMTHGVEEEPGIVGAVNVGSPAWQKGVPSGAVIDQIGDTKNPKFSDIRPIVMRSAAGVPIKLAYHLPGEKAEHELEIVPTLDHDVQYFPFIGVTASPKLTLLEGAPEGFGPVRPNSAAAQATPPFEPGDRIVATTDPDNPAAVTPIPEDPDTHEPSYFEFHKREVLLAGQPMTVRVLRGGAPVDISVPPAFHRTLGMRMRMGPITSLREDSPAWPSGQNSVLETGDVISQVEVPDPNPRGGRPTRYVSTPPNPANGEKELDPMRLPDELDKWAADKRWDGRKQDRTVKLTVLRRDVHNEKNEKPVTLIWDEKWDTLYRFDYERLDTFTAPLPITGLGLAYRVKSWVADVQPGSPAAAGGFKTNDVVKAALVRFQTGPGKFKEEWQTLKDDDQWAFLFTRMQALDEPPLKYRVQRGEQTLELEAKAVTDPTWPLVDRGLRFENETRLEKAAGIGDALALGTRRTLNTVSLIYSNLKAIVMRRVSPMSFSGPLTIVDVSYKIAEYDFFRFILFLGMINVNLAVVNFLPIPVLDGGHMVFLFYELIRGKPASEQVRVYATFAGLAFILGLMGFVIFLDVQRLFF
jgi:regulator of sigma E protease